jgi:hypothetical protein
VKVTEADVLAHRKQGSWRKLSHVAARIVENAENAAGSPLHARLGGGARVMLALNHRISNDIDLFIHDAQWIGYLTPRLNAYVEGLTSDYEEAAASLKLTFQEGEIDFIVAAPLLKLPEESSPETTFALDPVAEVLAKKLFHRGWKLQPRDLFDWWAIETKAPAAVPKRELAGLLKSKFDEIETALNGMAQSSRAAQLWDAVQAPGKPPFDETVKWGIRQLAQYRKLA